ncbi:Exostosin-2 [Portunus trituberculatus]|uniref:Exostosin-2 n=1 Tax=Portunus trituberculatus TaxID=210409 RepID=A0A5B7IAU6_PORTR|nr:Exostosin-2 [Portunus trituberculatus]
MSSPTLCDLFPTASTRGRTPGVSCKRGPDSNLTLHCRCDQLYPYPRILREMRFFLVVRGGRLGQSVLYDAMRAGPAVGKS